jgi:hypothetical protein
MSIFPVLLVGHLIADFPLQTPRILRWKFRGGFWLLPHIAVHAAVMSLLYQNLVIVAFIVICHFIIDWTKVKLNSKNRESFSFVMDQSAHIGVLMAAAHLQRLISPGLTPHHLTHNLPVILALAVVSAVFMFLNVVKLQNNNAPELPLPDVLFNYAFHLSKISGWSAVLTLLWSVPLLR